MNRLDLLIAIQRASEAGFHGFAAALRELYRRAYG